MDKENSLFPIPIYMTETGKMGKCTETVHMNLTAQKFMENGSTET
jgi:hypothetical protein